MLLHCPNTIGDAQSERIHSKFGVAWHTKSVIYIIFCVCCVQVKEYVYSHYPHEI